MRENEQEREATRQELAALWECLADMLDIRTTPICEAAHSHTWACLGHVLGDELHRRTQRDDPRLTYVLHGLADRLGVPRERIVRRWWREWRKMRRVFKPSYRLRVTCPGRPRG